MTLNELVNIASAAYPDGLIAVEYWDVKRERPRRNPKGGDTLALFIANEIADTYDPDASDSQQIEAVVKALARAREDSGFRECGNARRTRKATERRDDSGSEARCAVKNIRVGDVVTVTEREEAYYSGYAGNPVCFLEPGETGVIGAVKVPKVRRSSGGDYFCCIDFVKGGSEWRAGVDYGRIRLVKRAR